MQARHFDVEEGHIGVVVPNHLQGFDTICCLADNFHVFKFAQHPPHFAAGRGFIIGDDYFENAHGKGSLRLMASNYKRFLNG